VLVFFFTGAGPVSPHLDEAHGNQHIFLFLHGLDVTSPFLFSPWAGCNQSVSLFSMGWM
jgi:hypothetical protein